MEWEKYELDKKDVFVYSFVSEGPRGSIKKVVRFDRIKDLGSNVYNLVFGDLNEENGRLDDKVVSDNGDQLKVMHTVATAVMEFFNRRPTAFIIIKGSTSSRTRLYQMRIAGFLAEVTRYVEILGEHRGDWLPFQMGVNYERFLVYKKKA